MEAIVKGMVSDHLSTVIKAVTIIGFGFKIQPIWDVVTSNDFSNITHVFQAFDKIWQVQMSVRVLMSTGYICTLKLYSKLQSVDT